MRRRRGVDISAGKAGYQGGRLLENVSILALNVLTISTRLQRLFSPSSDQIKQ